MATDLLFSLPMPQNPVSGFYKDKLGPSDSAHLSKIKTAREPNNFEGESFLSTLRSVLRNLHRTQKTANINGTKRWGNKAAAPENKKNETPERTAELNEELSASGFTQENSRAAEFDQAPETQEYVDFIKMLEEMGFYHSDDGSDSETLEDSNSAEGKDLAVLKLLMAKLKQNEQVPSDELKAAFEHLRQFIAGTLAGNTPTGDTDTGQSVDLAQESARIFHWLEGFFAGTHHQSNGAGMGAGEGGPADGTFGPTSSDAGSMVEARANSIDLTAYSKAGDSAQPDENAGVASEAQSRNVGSSEQKGLAKLSSSAQINDDSKANMAVEKTDVDPFRPAEERELHREARTSDRVETEHQKPVAQNQMGPNHTEKALPAGIKLESGGLSNGESQTSAGEGPGSRLLQEAQSPKDGDVKVSSGIKEESVGKVIKTEAGTNDPGLLNPQSPALEKSVESVLQPKAADYDGSGLKIQALDQIVQKAAIHLRNGQHEARIDLKPEYLGHIRMQIISENHQVTVKIMTEHGFVKDMIQNNAHQLKSDLQHQGLIIDKLEVTVSHDADGSGTPKDRPGGMRTQQSVADNSKQEHPGRDLPQDRRRPRRKTGGPTTVDYFA